MAGIIDASFSIVVLGLASILAIVAIASHRRVGGKRLLFFAAAFSVIAAKGALYALNLFVPFSPFESWPLAFDVATLVLLYFGTLG